MTERPILFNDAMVRAILDGSKTQTRRPVKVQLPGGFDPGGVSLEWLHPGIEPDKQSYGFWINDRAAYVSPFGGPGDHLWVRECWAPYDTDKLEVAEVVYRASYRPEMEGTASDQGATATFTVPHHTAMEISHAIGFQEVYGNLWRPSIHMPRWASRITLLVKRVWIERLQDISAEDAIAEGVPTEPFEGTVNGEPATIYPIDPLYQLTAMWNSIYAGKGYGWIENPWVAGCEFERIPR